jgi:SlyX protein
MTTTEDPTVTSPDARLSELEIKASFADDAMDALNHTVFRQQQQIDALQRELRALRQQLASAAPGEPNSLRDELPPHY